MHHSFRSLAIGCLTLLLLLSAAFQPAAYADEKDKPRVTWSTRKVELAPGGTTTMNVTLQSNVAIQNVQLQLTKQLGNYITVSPGGPFNLSANTPVQVTITLKALPADAHSQSGEVKLRLGDRTLSQPLHVEVKVPKLRITWSRHKVELRPGSTTTVKVTLQSNVAIQNVQLQLTKQLGNYITVSPGGLFNLSANTPVEVTITLRSLPANAHSQEGEVKLRLGERTLSHSLEVKVKVSKDDDKDKDKDD